MRAYTAVVNPAAGGGRAAAALVPVAWRLRAAGSPVTVAYSRSLDDACQLAREAAGRGEVVVAVGGDGMVGAVAGAVVDAGGVLGIVPAGRGNDFARQVGLPHDPDALARVLLEGEPRLVDVAEADGRVVVGSVYAGVDSAASRIVNRARLVPRRIVYPYAAVRALATFRPATYRISVDGEELTERAYTVVAANSGYYGAGMHIAPDARVDDGLLDVVVIRAVSRLRLAAALRELYPGTHTRRPEVLVLRGREVRVAAERPIPVYGDGDPIGVLPVTVRVRPGALRLLSPPDPTPAGHGPGLPRLRRAAK